QPSKPSCKRGGPYVFTFSSPIDGYNSRLACVDPDLGGARLAEHACFSGAVIYWSDEAGGGNVEKTGRTRAPRAGRRS
ncbi:hypothetical protein, partial [Marinimicrococcus flavescens]|nr:hypothetical protein [Marinimicrococcus flavescens]